MDEMMSPAEKHHAPKKIKNQRSFSSESIKNQSPEEKIKSEELRINNSNAGHQSVRSRIQSHLSSVSRNNEEIIDYTTPTKRQIK